MAKIKPASESALGVMHQQVCDLICLVLKNHETRQRILNDNLEEVQALLDNSEDSLLNSISIEQLTAEEVPASLLTAAISFLKNNDITTVPERDNDVSFLQNRLANKSKRSVSKIPLDS